MNDQIINSLRRKWNNLHFTERFAVSSLLLFLLVMPLAIYLALSPTSPFSKAGGCPVSTPVSTSDCPEEYPAIVYFNPDIQTVGPNQQFTVDVVLNTGSHEVSAAEIQLVWDSQALRYEGFSPGDFLPVVLEYVNTNPQAGELSFAVGSQAENPVSGYGTIGQLRFSSLNAEGAYNLVFGNNTKVAAIYQQANVASRTYPAAVNISQATRRMFELLLRLEGVLNEATVSASYPSYLVPMALEIESASNSAIIATRSAEFIFSPSGSLQGRFANVPNNLNNTLYVKGPAHLRKRIGNSPFPIERDGVTRITLDSPLIAGDIMNNNRIDIFDYNVIVQDFGSRMPAEGSPADLDFDGDVDIYDYNLIVQNFAKVGE